MTGQPLDAIEALLPAYALNALDDEDRALVEGALEQEPRYREQVADYLSTVAQLSALHPLVDPSAALRERVLGSRPPVTPLPEDRLQQMLHRRDRRRSARAWRLAGAWAVAASLVLALVGLGSVSLNQRQQVRDLREQVELLNASVEDTEHRLIAQQALVYWVAQPGVSTVALTGTNSSPLANLGPRSEPRGLVMRAPDGESVLIGINLVPLPEHLSYQAWAWNSQGRPYNLGVFEVDEQGYAQVLVDYPYHAGTTYLVSVTVEPAGGSAKPSQSTVLIGVADNE